MSGETHSPCLLCGGQRFVTCFADGASRKVDPEETPGGTLHTAPFHILRCLSCGLMRRDTNDYGKMPPTPSASFSDTTSPKHSEYRGVAVSPELGHREIEEINHYKPPPGTFLNIGGDQADVLEIARMKGWYSAALRNLSSAVAGDNVPRFERSLSRLKYDVVRLEGMLERADNPKTVLDQISGVLRRRGLLVISTPDCDRWGFPLYGQGASLFPPDPPRWFFTAKTLKRLLTECGYKVLKITTYKLDFQPIPRNGFAALPPDIGTDGAGGDFIPPQALPSARFLRVLARADEKRATIAKRETSREPILREVMDPTEELVLSRVE